MQVKYNLIDRAAEDAVPGLCAVWTVHRAVRPAPPPRSRNGEFAGDKRFGGSGFSETEFEIGRSVERLAQDWSLRPYQVSLAWLLSRPAVASAPRGRPAGNPAAGSLRSRDEEPPPDRSFLASRRAERSPPRVLPCSPAQASRTPVPSRGASGGVLGATQRMVGDQLAALHGLQQCVVEVSCQAGPFRQSLIEACVEGARDLAQPELVQRPHRNAARRRRYSSRNPLV